MGNIETAKDLGQTIYTQTEADTLLSGKQETLASGINIKTINGESVLGSGDINVSMSASDILTAIKTVDGSGSGLDADTLDGIQASGFATASHTHSGYLSDTAHSFATNGYQKLSNGLIIQWGYFDQTTTSGTRNFNIVFPNACLNCTATVYRTTNAGSYTGFCKTFSASSFTWYSYYPAGELMRWIAIGY